MPKADAELLAAVKDGDTNAVRAALNEGANPNAADEFGPAVVQATRYLNHGDAMAVALVAAGADLAPLHHNVGWAVYFRNLDLVRKLIAAAADVNTIASWGTPLVVAARYGCTEIAETLIAAGANVNIKAPLVDAIKNGHSDIACALIEAGANVNIGPVVSDTSPIAQAVVMNNVRVLRALIEAGADLNQPSKAVITTDTPRNITIVSGPPLTLAARCGHAEAARLLIDAGADPLGKDADGLTPFEYAIRQGHAAVADVLRAAGGDQRRDTPEEQLLAAAESGNVEGVQRLLAEGVAIETRDTRKPTSGRTPLMIAADKGQVGAVVALVAAGANVNATDEPSGEPATGIKPVFNLGGLEEVEKTFRLGRTALMFAAAGGHVGAVHELVSAGADANAEDFALCTPLYLAARGGHAAAVAELLKSGAKVNARGPKGGTPLVAATLSGSAEAVETLLSHGAKVNVKSRDDGSPLAIACQKKRADLARLLLTRGDFKPDADAFASAFSQALTWNFLTPPTEDQVLAILEALVAAGAEPNCVDKYGNAPLESAAGSSQPKLLRVVSRLIELGADVNAGRGKVTALHRTVPPRNVDVAKILLEHGADVLAKNDDGMTVLQLAQKFYDKPDEDEKQFLALLESYAGKAAPSPPVPITAPRSEPYPAKPPRKKKRESSWKERQAPWPNFSKCAQSKKYLATLDELERLSGSTRRPLDGVDGAFSFVVAESQEVDVVKLQRRLLTKGAYIVALDFSGPTDPPQQLVCFPTTDKYEAVAAMQTEAPNYDMATGGIIHWLRKTEKEQPFILTNIGRDVIAGRFITAIKEPENLAERMIDFCPGIEDAHDDLADFANDLRRDRRFSFWWH